MPVRPSALTFARTAVAPGHPASCPFIDHSSFLGLSVRSLADPRHFGVVHRAAGHGDGR